MSKDCLAKCPNIKWCEIGVNVAGGSSAFLIGIDAEMRRTASKILEEAKEQAERCSGPIKIPRLTTQGIIHRKQVEKISYQCPPVRR